MTLSRRTFLRTASLSGLTVGAPAIAVPAVEKERGFATALALPSGKLCVLVYGRPRTALQEDMRSQVVVMDLPSLTVTRLSSPVKNLHSLVQAGPGGSQWWGVGHESAEVMHVFDRTMRHLEVRRYPGVAFRGHGLPWNGHVLVTAEALDDPMGGGFLLELDSHGNELARHPTGGKRPHEVVACGDYLAVAHYGNRPRQRAGEGGQSPEPVLLMDVEEPGVSFLHRGTLKVEAFYRIEGRAAVSHLGVTGRGEILAMAFNTLGVASALELYPLAQRDGAILLPMESYEKSYEVLAPMYRLRADQGVVETISTSATSMRRGQSFGSDPVHGTVVATFAASQTLYVEQPGSPGRWVSTLPWGVANPRGCALFPGTSLAAVSGHDDNIAIVDLKADKLVRLIGLPLGGHSHMQWLPA